MVTVVALVMTHFGFPEAAALTSTTSDQGLPVGYLPGCDRSPQDCKMTAAAQVITSMFQVKEEGRPIRGLPTESVPFSGSIPRSLIL